MVLRCRSGVGQKGSVPSRRDAQRSFCEQWLCFHLTIEPKDAFKVSGPSNKPNKRGQDTVVVHFLRFFSFVFSTHASALSYTLPYVATATVSPETKMGLPLWGAMSRWLYSLKPMASLGPLPKAIAVKFFPFTPTAGFDFGSNKSHVLFFAPRFSTCPRPERNILHVCRVLNMRRAQTNGLSGYFGCHVEGLGANDLPFPHEKTRVSFTRHVCLCCSLELPPKKSCKPRVSIRTPQRRLLTRAQELLGLRKTQTEY